MDTPETQSKDHSFKATVKEAVQGLSPLLHEVMNDVVHPWQKVLQGKGDAKDFAIVGAEAAVVAAAVVPGARSLAKNIAERSTEIKSLEQQWQTAKHLPFFDKPNTPPSPKLVDAFDKVHPSIGVVGTTKTIGDDTWFAQAAGFMVDDQGLFLTSHHEIKDKDAVSVFMSQERPYEVKLLGVDKDKDLALLRVVQSSYDDVFHPLPLSANATETGAETMAFGIRNGLKVAPTKFIRTGTQEPTEIFQGKVPGGFSGGPIVNIDAEAVAMALQTTNRFYGLPFSKYLSRRFGGERVYGVSSEDLRAFVDKNKKNSGQYLQPLDRSLTE